MEQYSIVGAGGAPPRRRPHKLHIIRFLAGSKAHSFRCSSSPHRNRFAGFRRGPLAARLPTASCTSTFRGRPGEGAGECGFSSVRVYPPVQTLPPCPAGMVPLPLQGRFGHLRCPQRRPAGGEAASHEMRTSRPGSVPTFRLRLAAEGGAEGRFAARTPPARGRGPSPSAMVRGSVRADAHGQRITRTPLRLRQGAPCRGGRGRAAERMSFRACEEANDAELVRTTARGFPQTALQSVQSIRTLLKSRQGAPLKGGEGRGRRPWRGGSYEAIRANQG